MAAILFDFGGTIDTDGVHWSEKFWELYERFAIGVRKPDVERAFVQSEAELLTDGELPKASFSQTLQKQLTLQFRILGLTSQKDLLSKLHAACYEEVGRTIAAARDILTGLRKKYSLGVVSNFTGNLEIVCAEFKLDTLFDVTVDSAVVGVRKPDPGIFDLALSRLKVQPANAFVVGDSYDRDIVPAKQLGCRTIWLKGKSWTAPVSTEAADYTVSKFREITAILT